MSRPPRYNSRPARPRRNRRRPNWLKIILNVVLLALVTGGVYLSLTSPHLRVNQIQVRGNSVIPVGELRAHADSALGSNIFLADTRKVRKSVLKNPVVRDVRVRKWPANNIIIKVQERQPTAVIAHDSSFYLTDEDAFVYRTINEPDENLPIIELPGADKLQVGAKKRLRPVRLAITCIRQADENDLTIGKISVDPRHNICLNMRSGLQIRLGPATDIEKKLSILHGVLAARPDFANDAVYLDLSCTAAPAWRSKDTTPFPPTL